MTGSGASGASGASGSRGTSGRVILVTGPVRSGKSRFAERLAAELAGARSVAYVATARVWDAEMRERVEAHRAARPAGWMTVEEPLALAEAVRAVVGGAATVAGAAGVAGGVMGAASEGAGVVLVESLDMWVSNRLLDGRVEKEDDPTQLDGERVAQVEAALLDDVSQMADAVERSATQLVVVTVEAGWGVVPPYPLGRAFRDLLGRVNAALAERADAVYLLVAGLPVDVKRLASGLT